MKTTPLEIYGHDIAMKIAELLDAKVVEIEGAMPAAEVIRANATMAVHQDGYTTTYSWRGRHILRVERYVEGWSQGVRIIS
ncbi:MAG TPA: hypothetical protein VL357_05990 [Rariglobus sp.]|jgi:hypothetical protein|nr:hypothetical protein [Rariglobus sp.]